jgi:hypothetical protein
MDHIHKGFYDYNSKRINISPGFPDLSDEKETVLHELNHAIYNYFFRGRDGLPMEEELVENMSKGMMMVMYDNPKLKDYLFNS